MLQRLGRIDQRVEPDAAQIFAGWMLTGWRLGTDLPTMVEASRIKREISAAMRGAELEARMAVEHAAKNQMRQRKRRLSWIADYVGKTVLAQTRPQRTAHRMNQHKRPE